MSMFLCAKCDNLRDSDDGCEEYGKTGLMCADCLANLPEIKTEHVYPPIPIRSFDWSAVTDDYDGAPDSGNRHQIGTGATRGEAIKDLVENYLEDA